MESVTTKQFRLCYEKLPKSIQVLTKKAYQKWKENNHHPSLHFKQLYGNIYSVRININYRALAVKQDNVLIWFWIGNHSNYDLLIKR